jgi:hypothetical protein
MARSDLSPGLAKLIPQYEILWGQFRDVLLQTAAAGPISSNWSAPLPRHNPCHNPLGPRLVRGLLLF